MLTDAADAEAICEAVTRPTMRFVAVKSVEQQAVLMLHKTRDLLVRQRTALINVLRAHLSEFGIVTGKGPGGVTRKPVKIATVGLANKTARIVWAVMTRKEVYAAAAE
jgi:transposase